MKTAVVQSKDLLGTCWSALRHTNSCHRCDKVFRDGKPCNWGGEPVRKGALRVLKERRERLHANLAAEEQKIDKAITLVTNSE